MNLPGASSSDAAATVVIARADSYEPGVLRPAIGEAVEACGGWGRLVRPGDRVLVKPNCISHVPPDCPAQTHPAVILEVCRQLLEFGARPFVGDSPAWGSLHGALRALGIIEDLNHLGVPIVPFKRPVKADNPRGKVFTRLTVDAAALEADAIVNLPKLKAHRQLLLTAAIKNMFGCVSGRRKAWWHVKAGSYENYFGLMLVETFEMLRPTISILDAVVAMEGNGPISGTPRRLGLVLASTDGPALERIAAELVGIKPSRLRTLQAAIELGIGTPHREHIRVAGADLDAVRICDFQMPRMMPIGFSIPRLVKGAFKNAWILHRQARQAEAS
ncbi:MAG TPA: DUF362 domain-containing protein [Phycisphaerae bacterium]|nr:DUF362 domain-containing protein [Phycisphaerae bacterium]